MTAQQLNQINKHFNHQADINDFVMAMRRLNVTMASIMLETDRYDHYKDIVGEGFIFINDLVEVIDPYLEKKV